jgi:tetratricopeptide (TPR) repeat protein
MFSWRDYEQALTEVQTTLEIDSNYVPTLYLLGRTYERLGKLELALATFQKVLTLNDAPAFLAALAHTSVISGDADAARKILDQLEARSKHRYVSAYARAIVHVALSEKQQAFSCLEQAYTDRCEMITWLKVDPHFDSIHTDPQFIDLLGRVGLPDDRPAGPTLRSRNLIHSANELDRATSLVRDKHPTPRHRNRKQTSYGHPLHGRITGITWSSKRGRARFPPVVALHRFLYLA